MVLKTLSAEKAAALDKELMSTGAFSIDQLMELAGLSVSQAGKHVFAKYAWVAYRKVKSTGCIRLAKARKCLLHVVPEIMVTGWNQTALEYPAYMTRPTIYYPKQSKNELYQRLTTQLRSLDIPFTEDFESSLRETSHVVDAIFGFSFSGEVREPFPSVIEALEKTDTPVTSVDAPSSWNIENGPPDSGPGKNFHPQALISLTAPKPLVKFFKGRHFVGGRFVPPSIAQKYDFDIPDYPGIDQIIELDRNGANTISLFSEQVGFTPPGDFLPLRLHIEGVRLIDAVVGGVGKSCLTSQFVHNLWIESYDPTIEDSYRKQIEVDGHQCMLEILDTAGTEQFTAMRYRSSYIWTRLSLSQADFIALVCRDLYMKSGQGFILVFSITSLSSLHELYDLRDQLIRIKDDEGVPLVIVGNKSDLEEHRAVPRARAFGVSQGWGKPYYETSARRRANVDEAFVDLCRQIIRQDRMRQQIIDMEDPRGDHPRRHRHKSHGREKRVRRGRRREPICTIL
ncbi:hypothetical protein MMC20_003372 [Loxospora ochrophaea]|nr:hypothetical protein [Loxospora ochrophaea]